MPQSPTRKATPVMRPRRCKYCKGMFVPLRTQDKEAKFCDPNHRKAYWRYGGLPFDKMKEQLMKEVRKELRNGHGSQAAQVPVDLREIVREEVRAVLRELFAAPLPNR